MTVMKESARWRQLGRRALKLHDTKQGISVYLCNEVQGFPDEAVAMDRLRLFQPDGVRLGEAWFNRGGENGEDCENLELYDHDSNLHRGMACLLLAAMAAEEGL